MKQKPIQYQKLGLSILFTLAVLVVSTWHFDAMTLESSLSRLGLPLVRLMGFIVLGLVAGQMIEVMGWTRRVAILAGPLFRYSRMGNHCSAAFTTAFISGVAANAMLLEFYEQKKISKLQLFLANYINQFPGFFLHLPTTVFIVLPLTRTAGVLYFAVTFLSTLFRTLFFLGVGRFFLAKPLEQTKPPEKKPALEKPLGKNIFQTLQKRLPGRIVNILIWVLPIYTLVDILSVNGFFNYLNQTLSAHAVVNIMPVEALSIVLLSFAAEFTSGFAAAGALMNAGVLTIKQTVTALLLGNVLAFPIRALRHQLPHYMGIFSPKMGLQLLVSGQIFRVLSIIIMGTLYYWVA